MKNYTEYVLNERVIGISIYIILKITYKKQKRASSSRKIPDVHVKALMLIENFSPENEESHEIHTSFDQNGTRVQRKLWFTRNYWNVSPCAIRFVSHFHHAAKLYSGRTWNSLPFFSFFRFLFPRCVSILLVNFSSPNFDESNKYARAIGSLILQLGIINCNVDR